MGIIDLDALKAKLVNSDDLKNEELKPISKVLMMEASREFSADRKNFFISKEVKAHILHIGKRVEELDPVGLRNILSCIGFIAIQYQEYDQEFYQFFKNNLEKSKDKRVRIAIARFFHKFPQFEDYEMKWDYIISIPKIPPKKESKVYFVHAIKHRIDEIPEKYKVIVSETLSGFLDNYNLVLDTKNLYQSLLNKLSK